MSDLPVKQESHPAHNMKGPTYPYHNDVLTTTPEQRNNMFTYDEPYQPNQNMGQGPVKNEADRNQ